MPVSYTLTGPGTGITGSLSTDFTLTVTGAGTVSITVTSSNGSDVFTQYADGSPVGGNTTGSITLATDSSGAQQFRVTWASPAGTHTLTPTNVSGATDPSPVTITVSGVASGALYYNQLLRGG